MSIYLIFTNNFMWLVIWQKHLLQLFSNYWNVGYYSIILWIYLFHCLLRTLLWQIHVKERNARIYSFILLLQCWLLLP